MGQKLTEISQMIEKFKQESKITRPSQKVLDALKLEMEQIDASISQCKELFLLNLNVLEDEEKLLAKEIDVYDKKILAWSTAKDASNASYLNSNREKNASSLNDRLYDSNLLKEVIDFDVI